MLNLILWLKSKEGKKGMKKVWEANGGGGKGCQQEHESGISSEVQDGAKPGTKHSHTDASLTSL